MSSHTDDVLNRHRARFERPQVESPTGSPVVGQMTSAWSSGCISNGGTNRRHVVDHASRDIRDALHLARREHMSEMDALVSFFRPIISCILDTELKPDVLWLPLRTANLYEI